MQGVSHSMSRRGAAKPAWGKALLWWSCSFFPAFIHPARRVTALVTTRKRWRSNTGTRIADVLGMTVDAAWEFFADEPPLVHSIDVLRQVGLGYLRPGQAATELSGGEAQRIKLATELQRVQHGNTLYVLDEPTTGLHPANVERLVTQLDGLVGSGNTVIVVEHDMRAVAGSDWMIDIGPGAGEEGGRVVASGTPMDVSRAAESRTSPYLARFLG
ncbi:MAG: excinuclease subunit [Bryobacterales bacterium]|nr:excinuclease subunit [Bryobacterales bacterium]